MIGGVDAFVCRAVKTRAFARKSVVTERVGITDRGASVQTASSSSPNYPPTIGGKDQPQGEQRAKDQLVVQCQPARQKDVEAGAAIAGVACRQSGQRASPAVAGQNEYLHQDQSDQDKGQPQALGKRRYRQQQDTAGKKGPRKRV